jgi:hypothetical protein
MMTDERLAALVRRACGVDSDGNVHKLLSLRVTFAPVTLRGVLAALRAPRNDDGEPLLRGSLRKLRVAGLPFRPAFSCAWCKQAHRRTHRLCAPIALRRRQ